MFLAVMDFYLLKHKVKTITTWQINKAEEALSMSLSKLNILGDDREIILKQEQEATVNRFGSFGMLVLDKNSIEECERP